MESVIGALIEWLSAAQQSSLRRAFVVWIKRVLLPGRMPGVLLPEVNNLLEIKTMLAERVIEWTEEWKQQGLQQGLLQGKREGKLEGKLEGKQEGQATTLMRLLTKRFGPVSPDTAQRLQTATAEQLDLWTDRILDAPTLAAVFDAH